TVKRWACSGVRNGRRVFPLPNRGVLAPSEADAARRQCKQGGTAKVARLRRLSPLSGRRAFLLSVAVQAQASQITGKLSMTWSGGLYDTGKDDQGITARAASTGV